MLGDVTCSGGVLRAWTSQPGNVEDAVGGVCIVCTAVHHIRRSKCLLDAGIATPGSDALFASSLLPAARTVGVSAGELPPAEMIPGIGSPQGL